MGSGVAKGAAVVGAREFSRIGQRKSADRPELAGSAAPWPPPAARRRRYVRPPARSGKARNTMKTPMEICAAEGRQHGECRPSAARLQGREMRKMPRAAAAVPATTAPDAMREMDGNARGMIQHAAGVVDAEAAPQDECVLVVGLGDPLVLALGHVRAGDRGVVAAGPAAEGHLHRERRESKTGPQPRAASALDDPVAGEHASSHRPARSSARIDSHSHSSSAKVVSPPTRWAVTISGLSSQVTVSMPSMPCSTTSTSSTQRERHAARPARAARGSTTRRSRR